MTCKEFATIFADHWCTVRGSPYLPDGTRCKVVGYWIASWSGQSAVVVVLTHEVRKGALLLTSTQPPVGWVSTAITFLQNYYTLDVARLTPDTVIAPRPARAQQYPHACPRCGRDALILALGVDCSDAACPVRRP